MPLSFLLRREGNFKSSALRSADSSAKDRAPFILTCAPSTIISTVLKGLALWLVRIEVRTHRTTWARRKRG